MAIYLAHPDRCFVYFTEQIVGQGLRFAAISHYRTIFEQYDPIDFGWDLIEIMGDDNDVLSLNSQAADLSQIVKTGGDIQSGRGLVQDQRCGLVYEGSSQQTAPLLAGRHEFELCIDILRHAQLYEYFSGSSDVLGADAISQHPMDADTGLKSGDDDSQSGCRRRVACVQIMRYRANLFA